MTANARGGASDNVGSIGKWITIAAGALCCAIGAITMLAWHLRLVSLLVVTPASTPMRYNAAVAFLVLGIALVGSARHYKKLVLGCSAFVGTLAVATALEYILGRSFGIDDLLFDQYSIGSWTLDPRIAPNTAVAFIAASAALLLLPRRNRSGWTGLPSAVLASVTFVLGVVAAVGYAASLEVAYSWGDLTGMSLVAAVGLLVLGTGILGATWQETRRNVSAVPAWTPVPLVGILATTTVLLWRALVQSAGPRASAVAHLVLAFGLLMAILTAIAARLAQLTATQNERVRSLNRSLRAISNCNELILQSSNEQQLLDGICHVLVEQCGHSLAWAGYPQHDELKTVRVMAAAGVSREYISQTSVTWADEPRGRGPTGTAIRTGEVHECKDTLADEKFAPWRESAVHYGLRSSIVIPIKAGQVIGTISIYSPHTDGFPAEERNLLIELAYNLAFGISALRMRAERDASEMERKASEERYRSLVLATAQVVWTTDPQGLVTRDMPTWRAFTGATYEQLQGWGWLDSVHPDDRKTTATVWAAAVNTRTLYETEYRLRRKDGEYRHVWVRGVPIVESDGQALREWVGTCTDITEKKHSEEALKRYAAELERSNGELQDFASIASHDLQEPLRKVLAFGEHLREHCEGKLDELGLDFLSRMQNAARRMSMLIEALLAYSGVATKAQPMQPVDMMSTVFGVLVDLEDRVARTHARIEFGPLPKVMADPTQLRQVIQNLIGNALKFHKPDATPHIIIEGRYIDEQWCELIVRDNGIGFDEKYLDPIFRPFQRLHGRNEYEGSGMGLAICRKVVARHGGDITARSQPGEGSTFIVKLPTSANVSQETQERTETWTTQKMAS